MSPDKAQQGVTLIELVVSIVILSVASTGILMVIAQAASSSADPMLREQAVAVAQSYREEILLQPLSDPDGTSGETDRALLDDIWDYDGLNDNSGAIDQNGDAVTGLEGYNITVDVEDAGIQLGGSPATRIEVTVRHDGHVGMVIPLSAYRLN